MIFRKCRKYMYCETFVYYIYEYNRNYKIKKKMNYKKSIKETKFSYNLRLIF